VTAPPDSTSAQTWSQRLARTLGSTTSDAITIDAPPEVVWAVYTNIERWPEWTASVTSAHLDPTGPLSLGTRASIKQPRLPRVVWTVTEFEPNRAWTWQNHSPGATTLAHHTLTPTADGRTHVDLSIDQRGVIGRPIGWLLKRLSRRYLRLEAEGLRRRSEVDEAQGPR
jgi:uncharacterized protein YndB with AHSA1/START domain